MVFRKADSSCGRLVEDDAWGLDAQTSVPDYGNPPYLPMAGYARGERDESLRRRWGWENCLSETSWPSCK